MPGSRMLSPPLSNDTVDQLTAGDRVLISGIIYTARDAAHKRLVELIRENRPLPMDLAGRKPDKAAVASLMLASSTSAVETPKRSVEGSPACVTTRAAPVITSRPAIRAAKGPRSRPGGAGGAPCRPS